MTMMEPFEIKYGKRLTAILAVFPVISEMMWVPVTEVPMGNATRLFPHFCFPEKASDKIAGITELLHFRRRHRQVLLKSAVGRLHLDLCGGGHRLHHAGGPLFGCFHRYRATVIGVVQLGE